MTAPVTVNGPSNLDELVARSRQLGADPTLVVHGGGNTSMKEFENDHLGRPRRVLWIKGSGTDLAAITSADFAGLYLDEVLPLRERVSMSDEDMVAFLRRCMLDPASPRPSIETLLHAWIPARHVDHVHADAICTLTNSADGAAVVAEALGEDVAFLDYRRPGFDLSKLVADCVNARAVVLAHHGLVTWGETGEESLRTTLELVEAARRYLRGRTRRPVLGDQPIWREEKLDTLLLTLRGALCARGHRVLHIDPEGRQFSDRSDAAAIVAAGPATADHVLRIGTRGMLLPADADARSAVSAFQSAYTQYWRQHHERAPAADMRDPAPTVVLVPGVGTVTSGRSSASARVAAEVAAHSLAVAAAVRDTLGEPDVLSEADLFDIEYWPLELAKLRPPSGELAGRVVVVTGAGSGIGRDIARLLSQRGAHLVLVDRDPDGLSTTAQDRDVAGATPALVTGDLTRDAVARAAIRTAVRSFGGLDGVVSNAGTAAVGSLTELDPASFRSSLEVNLTSHFLLTRHALDALAQQGLGGSLVYVASKNAFSPGSGFAAYSVAKAGEVQLARLAALEGGRHGIRANVVNPDAIFHGSRLWSAQVRASRAAAHGVDQDQLEDFYARRNVLGRRVYGQDVAEAVCFLLSERSRVTTGCVLTVDGGVEGAFPR